jgi:MFS family permease
MRIPLFVRGNVVINSLLAFLFMVNMSDGLFSPFIAVFITKSVPGGTLATVGFTAAIFSIVKSVVQIPSAKKIDETVTEADDSLMMIAGAILGTMATFGFMFVTREFHLYLLAVVNGFSAAFMMAAYYAVFSRHVDRGKESYEWSLFSIVPLTLASAAGGVIGGLFADRFGFPMTFFTAGSLAAIATVLLVFLHPVLSKKHSHWGKGGRR